MRIFVLHEKVSIFEHNIVKTQRNSTQLNSTKATQKQLHWVRHSTHLEPTPPTPPTTINFSGTSRPARELKFGT